ncbi:MAG: YihY/virulence factor BrkB family protein, partial [Gammaproteobacteria bacterium]|nr:YihY/virulence factor BrkB family protein [Gammaproteobacteria bacterium]
VRTFFEKQGLLLAGSVAYYALLSLIPLAALILLALSKLIDPLRLMEMINQSLSLLFPNQVEQIMQQITHALEYRDLVSGFGVLVLFIFSGAGFRVLSQTLNTMLDLPPGMQSRKQFLLATAISYGYVFLIGAALLILSVGGSVLIGINAYLQDSFHYWSELAIGEGLLFLALFTTEVVLLTSFYRLLPSKKVPIKYAFVGGLIATVMWSIVSQLIAWYYSNLSSVNLIYGTFATTIIVLLTLEFASTILLLGARVIAEYQNQSRSRVSKSE